MGVRNIIGWAVLTSKGICQNLLMASSLLNTVAPLILWSRSSNVGIMQRSLLTSKFNFRSVQILTAPDLFITGTMGEHQSVGSATSAIPPEVFILMSSSFLHWWYGDAGCCVDTVWCTIFSRLNLHWRTLDRPIIKSTEHWLHMLHWA